MRTEAEIVEAISRTGSLLAGNRSDKTWQGMFDALLWCAGAKDTYTEKMLSESEGLLTPEQRSAGRLNVIKILEKSA